MTLRIELTPETEARLREQAAAAGKDLTTFARESLEETAAESVEPDTQHARLSTEQWVARWHAWTARFPALGHIADDSRESIYEGCGE
jgi:uncharacterized protein (DUF1778 family)